MKTCACGKQFVLDIKKHKVYEVITPSEQPFLVYPEELDNLLQRDEYLFSDDKICLENTIRNRLHLSDIVGV
jgi:hypothetical protein